MKTWPLERIPHLGEQAFTAILQSIYHQEMSKLSPLDAPSQSLEVFSALRWQDAGCTAETLEGITARYAAMFHVPIVAPRLEERTADLVAAALRLWSDTARPVTFFTSGSTGEPKPCTHLEPHVRQEITSLAPLLHERKEALVMAPFHHMYGFTFGLLLPLALGIPIRTCPPLPTVVAASMRPGDLVVGIPLLWTRLVDMKGWDQGASHEGEGITVFTATSPTPEETMHALIHQGFTVHEFFGASEVGVVCTRKRPDEAFTLLPHVCRVASGEALQRELPGGEVRDYPMLDAVDWVDEHHFFPKGRKDKAVQVGGVNVFPQRVEAVLAGHPDVRDCSVRLMRPEEGFRLKAFIVPAPDRDLQRLRAELQVLARQSLRNEEVPTAYTFGDTLPRSQLGKPVDW